MPARSQPKRPVRSAPVRRGELAAFQRAIAGTLMRPLTSSEGMQRSSREVAEQFVKPNDRLTSFERLQIYNQQYWWRLLGSIREDFRGTLAVLGERKFERLAVAYLELFGSQSWNLRDLGQGLEAYAREHPEATAPHTALALDMIRVEWARVIAFDGPEKPRLNPQRLGGNAEKLRVGLQPYVTLLALSYPIDKMLARMRKRAMESSSNAVSASTARRTLRLTSKPESQPVHIAVHRVDLIVYYKRLEAPAYRLLVALRDGHTLSDACAAAFGDDVPEDAPAQIQGWFATWMRLGWLH